MSAMLFVALFLTALAAMEGVAYLTHKHLMHGPLWFLHESHHRPRRGFFERNDLFGIFFAIPSIVLIGLGTHGTPWALPVGLGMAAYGLCYFGFHDVVVHRRVPLRWRPRGRYFDRIVRAHLVHHRTLERDGALHFGFLWSPPDRSSPAAGR
jgi:beta-carotene 3-hydroxylase